MQDSRSKKLLLVAHCVLNQNSKVEGIARYPGTYRPAVDLILQSEVGIYQLPCPEMMYLGISRWSAVKAQYSSPFFRRHCRALAERVMDEVEDYTARGYEALGVLGMDGSPACGVELTNATGGAPWGGRIIEPPARRLITGSGAFMDALREAAAARGLSALRFIALPESDEAGSLDEGLARLRALLWG